MTFLDPHEPEFSQFLSVRWRAVGIDPGSEQAQRERRLFLALFRGMRASQYALIVLIVWGLVVLGDRGVRAVFGG